MTPLRIFAAATILFLAIGCQSLLTKKLKTPHFWIAEKNGVQLYIFGTVHRYISINEVPTEVLNYLERSDIVFVETDIWNWDTKRTRTLQAEGKSIQTFLSPEEQKVFEAIFAKSSVATELSKTKKGFNLADCDTFCASVIVRKFLLDGNAKLMEEIKSKKVFLKDKMLNQYNELDAIVDWTSFLDKELVEHAKKKGKTLDYLDDDKKLEMLVDEKVSHRFVKENLKLIQDKNILADHRNHIISLYENFDYIKKLVNDYRSGNPMDATNEDPLENEFDKLILFERNKNWVDVVQRIHHTYNKMFIAAGVAHMYGKGSFLELLEEEGFAIKRSPLGPP